MAATEEEEEAIEAMRSGDIRGLETVVRLHQTRALRMALALTGNQAIAEDMVSDAFVFAYEQIANLEPGRPFEPWFRGIVRNLARQMHRRSARLVAGPEVDALIAGRPAPASSDPAVSAENAELRRALLGALNELTHAQRDALVLRYFYDLDVKTVADCLELPLNTVKAHLRRGRQRLVAAIGRGRLRARVIRRATAGMAAHGSAAVEAAMRVVRELHL